MSRSSPRRQRNGGKGSAFAFPVGLGSIANGTELSEATGDELTGFAPVRRVGIDRGEVVSGPRVGVARTECIPVE